MPNPPASQNAFASGGRIAIGLFVTLMSGGHILAALHTGSIKVLMFSAALLDRPVFFVILLAIWVGVLASGFSSIGRGVAALRTSPRQLSGP